MPKGLTLGAPSHRCGKSLLRSFKGDLDGKRGLRLAVVESDDPSDAMPSRFKILFDEFQLVATHGDGPPYSLDHGSWNPGSYGGPPGQLVQACQLALLGLSGASNEPLPGGKLSNGAHCSHRVAGKLAAVPWSELVEPGPSAA